MWIFVNIAMLVFATLIAGVAAVGVYWLLLRATVELMRPAAVRPAAISTRIAQRTAEAGGAFARRSSE